MMTDAQLLTLAIAVIVPLSMLLYSNSRITEVKETLRADIRAFQAIIQQELTAMRGDIAAVRGEIAAVRTDMKAGFESAETKLKIHELEHHR